MFLVRQGRALNRVKVVPRSAISSSTARYKKQTHLYAVLISFKIAKLKRAANRDCLRER